MLSREEKILSELIVSRGLAAREVVERCARDRDASAPHRSLAEAMVDAGHLDAGEVRGIVDEARAVERSLAGSAPAGARLGEFRLLHEIGRGGMGIVYEAEQESLSRRVAVKVLPSAIALDERRVARFLREARTAARLSHPGIVQILTSGRQEGVLFFAMELIDGRSLDELVAEGPLPPRLAARLSAEAAAALAHAHDAGLVHRDVKPGNLLITNDGRVKVTDFGLVHDSLDLPGTLSQHVLGTPAYMAPEQARGEAVDARSDIYGLGAVLYVMLAGRPPYPGEIPSVVLAAVLAGPPARLSRIRPDVPRELISICERAMARDPRRRFTSAAEMTLALRRFLSLSRPSPSGRINGRGTFRSKRRGGRRLLIPGAVVAVSAIVGLTLYLWSGAPAVGPVEAASSPAALWSRIDSGPERKFSPAYAPNGPRLAFSVEVGDGWEIDVLDLQGGIRARLTDHGVHPAFSPDGAFLAFQAFDREGSAMAVMDVASREIRHSWPRTGGRATWSPDGTRLAVATPDNVFFPRRRPRANRLVVIDVSTGAQRVLPVEDATQPAWSPHGERIAYASSAGGRSDIWTVSPEDGTRSRLTDDLAEDWSPIWSPEGTDLYFVSLRDGAHRVWHVEIDETSGRALSGFERLAGSFLPSFSSLAISSDGSHLAAIADWTRQSMHRVSFDAGTGGVGGDLVDLGYAERARQPDISPDGTSVTFIAGRNGVVRVCRLSGKDRLEVARGGAAPRWSPDGTRIAFHAPAGGSDEIWIAALEGRNEPIRVTDTPGKNARFPVWSPDGHRLAYSVEGEGAFIVDPDSPGRMIALPPLTDIATARFRPRSWSADGKLLAGSGPGIVLYDVEARRYERLTDAGENPLWVDGERLLFFLRGAVWQVDRSTGAAREVLTLAPFEIDPVFALTPDRRFLYVSVPVSDADLLLADIDAQGVR